MRFVYIASGMGVYLGVIAPPDAPVTHFQAVSYAVLTVADHCTKRMPSSEE